jgi:hypothetical protein
MSCAGARSPRERHRQDPHQRAVAAAALVGRAGVHGRRARGEPAQGRRRRPADVEQPVAVGRVGAVPLPGEGSAALVVEEPLRGMSDARCWRHAQTDHAVVLTTNARDFVALAATGAHDGLLLVYRDNDRTRDMTAKDIAAAVDRVAETYPERISEQVLTLNGFRW